MIELFISSCTLAKDAEQKSGDKGVFAVVDAAHNSKDSSGNQTTDWVGLFFSDRFKNLYAYLVKGSRVMVRGTEKLAVYTDKNGVSKINRTLFVNTVELLGGGENKQTNDYKAPLPTLPPQPQPKQSTVQSTIPRPPLPTQVSDDLPF